MTTATLEIVRIVAAALLSLAIYGLANMLVDTVCEKKQKRVRVILLTVIAVVAAAAIFGHFNVKQKYKGSSRITVTTSS